MKYLVNRAHEGDKWYPRGSIREARENDVAHLVDRGTLEKMAAKPLNKAAYVAETKSAPLAGGPTGQDGPAQSSQAVQVRKKRASKKSKAAAK